MFDQNVVSYLELLRVPYTGCNPRGLMLARDKALSKKLLAYHRMPVPDFTVFRVGRKPCSGRKRLKFPLIVKSLTQESSIGISQASVVEDEASCASACSSSTSKVGTDAIVERYVDGPRALRRRDRQPAAAGLPGVGDEVRQDAARTAGASPPSG